MMYITLRHLGFDLEPIFHMSSDSSRNLAPVPISTGGLGTLAKLPAELRNEVYSLLLASHTTFRLTPLYRFPGRYSLSSASPDQTLILTTLNNLMQVSRLLSHEARTFFYASNQHRLLCFWSEYMPVFVRWLEGMGLECRTVLKYLTLRGYWYYEPSHHLTGALHDLLRNCVSMRHMKLQVLVRHIFELRIKDLDEYLDSPIDDDPALPSIELSTWAETISRMPVLEIFELDLIRWAARDRIRSRPETGVLLILARRGETLAEHLQNLLIEQVANLCNGRDVDIRVRWVQHI